jgi:amino acid adenylation domain-containing protein
MNDKPDSSDRRGRLSPARKILLERRLQAAFQATTEQATIPVRPRQDFSPLSLTQEGLWVLNQFNPDEALFNRPVILRMRGDLDRDVLIRSLETILQRHTVLRGRFRTNIGRPILQIDALAQIEADLIDLDDLPPSERLMRANELVHDRVRTPVNLAKSPLLRCTLLNLAKQDHILVLVFHHICFDAWSEQVLLKELSRLYGDLLQGDRTSLPDLPIQYADFAAWQRERIRSAELEPQIQYWREKLADLPPAMELPTDHPRPAIFTNRGAQWAFDLPAPLHEALKDFSLQRDTTPNIVLLTAFFALLYRRTAQADAVIGMPIAGRTRVEMERLIGLFINTLVLRCDLSGQPTFLELLERVRKVAWDAYANQEVPLETLVNEIRLNRDLSRPPFFQILFNYENLPHQAMEFPNLDVDLYPHDQGVARYDLSLELSQQGGGLHGVFVYNTDLYEPATIQQLADDYAVLLQDFLKNPYLPVQSLRSSQDDNDRSGLIVLPPPSLLQEPGSASQTALETLLEGVLERPERSIHELLILTEDEKDRQIQGRDFKDEETPQPGCLHERFELQVRQTPGLTAVVCGSEKPTDDLDAPNDEALTYSELNARANRLARRLLELGVRRHSLVGICMERSLDLLVGILGVLKAGGAYVPLDPTQPRARLELILRDTGLKVLVSKDSLGDRFHDLWIKLVYLDSEQAEIDCYSPDDLNLSASNADPAYVIYTSGSTGEPKGVVVSHYNVTRLFKTTAEWFAFNNQDVWTLFHSPAFDFSVWEIWGALLHGGRLVVVPFGASRDPKAFARLISKQGVTVLNQTPSAFYPLLQQAEFIDPAHNPALRLVIFGGEALNVQLLKPWFGQRGEDGARLVNMYGITETTVHATYRPLKRQDLVSNRSVIGAPLNDLQIYLVDNDANPVPIGVIGEIIVGGAGVSQGYLNHPDLTAEKFIPDPFSSLPGARCYLSGDLARRTPDGDLEYIGRRDQQVKIRGFRIELGEIESALGSYPGIKGAAVKLWPLGQGETGDDATQLAAYLVAEEPLQHSVLRRYLKDRLPEYMLPAAFVFLSKIPLTPNGKVDREALPAPSITAGEMGRGYQAPRTNLEQVLTRMWAEILGVDRLGVNDNFFELGGHSIMAIRLTSMIADLMKIDVGVALIFNQPTVAGYAGSLVEKYSQSENLERIAELVLYVVDLPEERLEVHHEGGE